MPLPVYRPPPSPTVLNLTMQDSFSWRRGCYNKSPYEDMKEEHFTMQILAGLSFICSGLGRSGGHVGGTAGITQPCNRGRWRQTVVDHCKDSDLSNDHERKPSAQAAQRRGVALKGLVQTGKEKDKRPTINKVKGRLVHRCEKI